MWQRKQKWDAMRGFESEWLVGKRFLVERGMDALCCGCSIPEGTLLEVTSQPSPNRVMVAVLPKRYGHRVKRSTLTRCCKEVSEEERE